MDTRKNKSHQSDGHKKIERSETDNRMILYQVNRINKIIDDLKPRRYNNNEKHKALTQLFPHNLQYKDKAKEKNNELTRMNDDIAYIENLNLNLKIRYNSHDTTLKDD